MPFFCGLLRKNAPAGFDFTVEPPEGYRLGGRHGLRRHRRVGRVRRGIIGPARRTAAPRHAGQKKFSSNFHVTRPVPPSTLSIPTAKRSAPIPVFPIAFLAMQQRSRWRVGAMNFGVAVLARAAEALHDHSGRAFAPWPKVWHSVHRRGRETFSRNSFTEPCGSWQFRQFSRTGACSNRNGPRFSAWHL